MLMGLFLVEFAAGSASRAELSSWLNGVADTIKQAGGDVIEAQVATDLRKIYIVAKHADGVAIKAALTNSQWPVQEIAAVRLVGAALDDITAAAGTANYLVEWDLPAGLSMEKYLARKKEKSPLYAQVPKVKFRRTYVREDMAKCLCFYEAPDEAAVVNARQVVQAPVDRISKVEGGQAATHQTFPVS
jgi:hypothetical protein